MIFRDTTLFHTKAFAFTLLAAALVWVAAQARSHMKAKILYVDPVRPTHAGGDTKTVAAEVHFVIPWKKGRDKRLL